MIDLTGYKNEDKYALLGRLESDCKYFLGYGTGSTSRLWSGSVEQQFKDMKQLYKSFRRKDRPRWITMKQIRKYYKAMKNYKY